MKSKMAIKWAIDATQPDIAGAYTAFYFISCLYVMPTPIMMLFLTHNWHDFVKMKERKLVFEHNFKSKMASNMAGSI